MPPPKNQLPTSQLDPGNAAIGDVMQVLDAGGGLKRVGFGPPVGGGGGPLDEEAIQALIDATPDRWVVDPHLEQFGARGNARTWFVANRGTDLVANDTLVIANHDFTIMDVGKKVHAPDSYAAYEGRTIVAITAGGDARVDIPFSGWMDNFVVTVGTDDTAALQSALDYARDIVDELGETTTVSDPALTHYLFGSLVQLRAGHRYLVCNTQARFNAGNGPHAALTVGRRSGLVGAGGAKYQSQIVIGTGNFGHGIMTPGADTYTDFVILAGFAMFCYGDIGGDQNLDGIHFDIAFDGYQNVDAYNLLKDIHIQTPARDGLFMKGRGETFILDINVARAKRFGVYFEHMADYVCFRVNVGGSGKTGIRIESSGASHWHATKSYYNGIDGDVVTPQYDDPDGAGPLPFGLQVDMLGKARPAESHDANCANWHILSDNDHNGAVYLHGCESQESRGAAIVIEAPYNWIDMIIADPFRTAIGPEAGRPAVKTGIYLKGPFAHNNVFNCFCLPNLGTYQAQNWGYATSVVYIDALAGNLSGPQANKGDIWYAPEPFTKADGTAHAGMNFNGGAAAQGAIANAANTKLRVNGVALT